MVRRPGHARGAPGGAGGRSASISACCWRGLELAATDRVLELGYDDLETPLLLVSGTVADGLPAPRQVVSLRPTVDLVEEAATARARPTGALRQCLRCAWPTRSRPQTAGSYDVVLLLAPHYLGNERVRTDIATAHRALRPDGVLFFQTHRRQGGETFVRYVDRTVWPRGATGHSRRPPALPGQSRPGGAGQRVRRGRAGNGAAARDGPGPARSAWRRRPGCFPAAGLIYGLAPVGRDDGDRAGGRGGGPRLRRRPAGDCGGSSCAAG